MYVCICKAVTEAQIHRAIENGATRLRDLQQELGVATQCGACAGCARGLLSENTCKPVTRPLAALSLQPALSR